MKKILLFTMVFLFSAAIASAQSDDNLPQHPVKRGIKDPVFDKAFSALIVSGKQYFKDLKSGDGIKSMIDTVYSMNFKFKEKNEATLTCEKGDNNLAIRFALDKPAFDRFFAHLNASLPVNYVYTLDYDASSQQSNYSFFPKAGTKAILTNYPLGMYITRDAVDIVYLSLVITNR